VYGSAVARAHATQLWQSFQIEVHVHPLIIPRKPNNKTLLQIFQPADPETEALALKASQSLILTLYPSSSKEILDGLITDIVHECLKALKEPEKNQAQHGVKVLAACIATTRQFTFT
jgi:DNA repair/transcription protein MET18/MMS19